MQATDKTSYAHYQNPYYDQGRPPPSAPPLYSDLHLPLATAYVIPTDPNCRRDDFPSQTDHNQTLELIRQANQISSRILGDSVTAQMPRHSEGGVGRDGTSRPWINSLNFSDRSLRLCNNPTTHIHSSVEEEKSKKKKDDSGNRILFGVIGFVVMAATAYFTGKATAQGEDVADEAQAFETSKILWNSNRKSYNNNYSYKQLVDTIIPKVDAILQREKANRTHKLALLIFAFIAGSAAVTGAVIGSKAFMASALVMGSITTVAALFKLGYTYFSNRDRSDALNIQGTIEAIETIKVSVNS